MADVKGAQNKNTSEKITKLTKYVDDLKTKLNSGMFGSRHEQAPEVYRAWLVREIDQHSKKIEALRLK